MKPWITFYLFFWLLVPHSSATKTDRQARRHARQRYLTHRKADEAQVPLPTSPRVLSAGIIDALVTNSSSFLHPASHAETRRSSARLECNGTHYLTFSNHFTPVMSSGGTSTGTSYGLGLGLGLVGMVKKAQQ